MRALQPAIVGRAAPPIESFFDRIAYSIAHTLILKKIHSALGLDKVKLCSSGAAPLSEATFDYFASIGVPIMDMYGMSECTGPQVCAFSRLALLMRGH